MVLRFLIRFLANDHLIQKLADSWIMRKTARKVVEAYHKGLRAVEGDEKLKKGFEKISEELKKRRGF